MVSSGSDEMVYDVLRLEEDGQMYGYPVIFVRDELGDWKIMDFYAWRTFNF